jgi:hypothetical protein
MTMRAGIPTRNITNETISMPLPRLLLTMRTKLGSATAMDEEEVTVETEVNTGTATVTTSQRPQRRRIDIAPRQTRQR